MNLKTEWERWKKGVRAVRLYRQCVHRGDLCFDIGANHGSRSMIFTLLGARTIAAEPNARLTHFLKKFPRVTVENVAVSDEMTTKAILLNANDQISSLNPKWRDQWPNDPEWLEVSVKCVTLDWLIEKYGTPDFCKIDVEGHEAAVLRGLNRPVPRLSFEVTPGFEAIAQECMQKLLSLGAYEFNFSAGDDFKFAGREWISPQQVLPMINMPGDVYARLKK